jgi:hypothetical protein
MTTGEVDAFK